MQITEALGSHLYGPDNFRTLKPGDWVFIFRHSAHILDASARPEQVTTHKKGQITTSSGRTFLASSGKGSPACKQSRQFRICRYTGNLKAVMQLVIETRTILRRVSDMDIANLPLTPSEAKELEAFINRMVERKKLLFGKRMKGGILTARIRKGLLTPEALEIRKGIMYQDAAHAEGSISAITGNMVPKGTPLYRWQDQWYVPCRGSLVEIFPAMSLVMPLTRAVVCQRVVKEEVTLPSL